MRIFKQLLPLSLIMFAFSCTEENISGDSQNQPITKQSLTGFWTYKKVLINNVDIEVLTPGFTVSNYLHLKGDDSYGKCYILGDWSLLRGYLKLDQHDFSNQPSRYYKVISVSENSLTLEIKLPFSEYEIGLPQFDENDIITVTEIFER